MRRIEEAFKKMIDKVDEDIDFGIDDELVEFILEDLEPVKLTKEEMHKLLKSIFKAHYYVCKKATEQYWKSNLHKDRKVCPHS